jgi:RNA 2',3'-cyclic 3'-phosphodiesterase
MKTVRAFIGVQLPNLVRDELADVSWRLHTRIQIGGVRWIQPERMHLTLRFLGETAVSLIPQIADGLDKVCANQQVIMLQLSGVGCFPNDRHPRVIWVGLTGETQSLQALKQMVDQMLLSLGWALEKRPFNPHLTLGRVKDVSKVVGMDWGVRVKGLAVPITAVHLIESQLKPTGPEYRVQHSVQLR